MTNKPYKYKTCNLSFDPVAIGVGAGTNNQGAYSVAIGYEAGNIEQDIHAVAIGYKAGKSYQGQSNVAVGNLAGLESQANFAVSIGCHCGMRSQGVESVAIGHRCAMFNQGDYSVAIGHWAGCNSQETRSVAVGDQASAEYQGSNCVSVGYSAASNSQGSGSIAIGYFAGSNSLGQNSIAIGSNCGLEEVGDNTVLLGNEIECTYSNSLVFNCSPNPFVAPNAGFFIAPSTIQSGVGGAPLLYNLTTGQLGTLVTSGLTFTVGHTEDTGIYTINFSSALVNTHYVVSIEVPRASTSPSSKFALTAVESKTVNGFNVITANETGTLVDLAFSFSVIEDKSTVLSGGVNADGTIAFEP